MRRQGDDVRTFSHPYFAEYRSPLREKTVRIFQWLYQEYCNTELSYDEALAEALRLLRLFSFLCGHAARRREQKMTEGLAA